MGRKRIYELNENYFNEINTKNNIPINNNSINMCFSNICPTNTKLTKAKLTKMIFYCTLTSSSSFGALGSFLPSLAPLGGAASAPFFISPPSTGF